MLPIWRGLHALVSLCTGQALACVARGLAAMSRRVYKLKGLLCSQVGDLQYASPATVSRCGMVYVDPKNLKYQPYWKKWVQQIPNKVSIVLKWLEQEQECWTGDAIGESLQPEEPLDHVCW